jgi:hypothetical protein
MSINGLVRTALLASMLVGLGATRPSAAGKPGVIVASGELDDRFLADSLFHIGEFWMKVAPDTEFHRWLSRGMHREVVISLLADPAAFVDAGSNVRMLVGTLIHSTAPNPTPMTTDVVGRLPSGNAPLVHVLLLQDNLTGSLGAVTFQTSDYETAVKFAPYDGTIIGIVITLD